MDSKNSLSSQATDIALSATSALAGFAIGGPVGAVVGGAMTPAVKLTHQLIHLWLERRRKRIANGEITSLIGHIEAIILGNFVSDEMFLNLIQGMKWNLNSRSILKDYNDSDSWSIIKNRRSEVSENLLDIWDKYHELAQKAAVRYATINLALKWTDLIHKFFPESIRCRSDRLLSAFI